MTVLYVDTSALLKRVIVEPESGVVRALLGARHDAGDLLTASSITWIEVWRSLRRALLVDVEVLFEAALSGMAEFLLGDAVLARPPGGTGRTSVAGRDPPRLGNRRRRRLDTDL